MKTKEQTFIDEAEKRKWGEGKWLTECDRMQWADAATGLPCLAIRNLQMGNWCGYVGLPPSHPCYGLGYDEVHHLSPDLDVHGGLTYAGACDGHCICHEVEEGEEGNVWWLGFDLAHGLDYVPALRMHIRSLRDRLLPEYADQPDLLDGLRGNLWGKEIYRDLDYVKSECQSLAAQLAVVKGGYLVKLRRQVRNVVQAARCVCRSLSQRTQQAQRRRASHGKD